MKAPLSFLLGIWACRLWIGLHISEVCGARPSFLAYSFFFTPFAANGCHCLDCLYALSLLCCIAVCPA